MVAPATGPSTTAPLIVTPAGGGGGGGVPLWPLPELPDEQAAMATVIASIQSVIVLRI
jgi:hypothetical protein